MFIVLDGPDGSGTTTHVKRLAVHLQGKGVNVFLTAEPSQGPTGKRIRNALIEGNVAPEALQRLFAEDRAWHLENELLSAHRSGKTIICDRYVSSTLAYGAALGLDHEWLRSLNAHFLKPDVLIFLLPPLDVCWERMGERAEKDSLETRELQEKVHAAYREIAEEQGAVIIDSAGSIGEVAGMIERILDDFSP